MELPEVAKLAIDDPEEHFSATHGLMLRQLTAKYPELEWEKCIALVNEKQLSVAKLKRIGNAEYRSTSKPAFTGLFQEKGTNVEAGEFRLSPIAVKVSDLSADEKQQLLEQLDQLRAALG